MNRLRKKEEMKMLNQNERVNTQNLRIFLEKLHLDQYDWKWDIGGGLLRKRWRGRSTVQIMKD